MTKKFSQARCEAFLAALRETGNQTIAAERAKVSRSWVQLHRSSDPAFKRAVEEMVAEAKARLGSHRERRPPAGWGYLDGEELVVSGTGGSGGGKRVQIARARMKQWSPRVEERVLTALLATCNVKAACAEVGPAARVRRSRRLPAPAHPGTVAGIGRGAWAMTSIGASRGRMTVTPRIVSAIALSLALAACGGGASDRRSATPAGVAELTTIDFANVADYSPAGLPAYFDHTVTALDNAPAPNAADNRVATLGRVLFHDLRLSTNDRASCASCHRQALGFTDSMRFSNGISNAATTEFHAMRLGNLRYWRPGSMFWDRRAASVEAQASQPFHSLVEMGWGGAAGGFDDLIRKMEAIPYYPELFAWAFDSPEISEPRIQQALARFVRAMVSSSSRWDEGYAQVFSPTAPNRALDVDLPNFTARENRGRHLFMTAVEEGGAGCSSCHLPPTFALAPDARSNGLDAGETRLFKAPSLRNVGLTGPYMHDGRFATLAEVVDFYDHGIQQGPALDDRLRRGDRPLRLDLSAEDRAALAAFLLTLNDPVLTTDARFGDPFRR